jgi:uncharacterized membrane protein YeaQ/YmgE (transglycosylase-associated protein family)
MFGPQSLLVILIVGPIAGYFAGPITKGTGNGVACDIVVGIVGAFIGIWLWNACGIPTIGNFWINAILTATAGALALPPVSRRLAEIWRRTLIALEEREKAKRRQSVPLPSSSGDSADRG